VSTGADDPAAVRRTCFAYLAIFGWAGLNQAYLPVWFASRGLSESEIALVIGLPMFVRLLVTPAFGRFADTLADRRWLMAGMATAALVLAAILGLQRGFWPVLALYVIMMIPLQNISPIFDAGALDLVRRGLARDYGRMRLWGSAGYAIASLLGGYILWFGGLDAVFVAFLGAIALLILAAVVAPSAPPAVAATATVEIHVTRRPAVMAMMAAAALTLASQATWNGFGSIRLRELGVSDQLIGIFWAAATCSEMAMFWAGPQLAVLFSPPAVIALGAVAAVIRWSLMATDPGIALTFGLQLMHALTYSCAHLGLQAFFARTVSSRRGASAQATFVTMTSVMLGLAVIASGPIYQRFGGGAYLFAAGLAACALLILLAFRQAILAEFRTQPDG
jgi:MFS transporter, PPP family, 3-phenylpropionic acid transporter